MLLLQMLDSKDHFTSYQEMQRLFFSYNGLDVPVKKLRAYSLYNASSLNKMTVILQTFLNEFSEW